MYKTIFGYLLILIAFLLSSNECSNDRKLSERKLYHKSVGIEGEKLAQVATLSEDLTPFHTALDKILVPRVVGTENHDKVKQFLESEMQSLGWTVERDSFYDKTPLFGQLLFENIIATHNPRAKRFLDLACHFDSKYFREHSFVGATDSAVPCAIMIQIAHNLNKLLSSAVNDELSLRFIFFDGEEAFQSWSSTDSIYGARHLAAKWASTPYPACGDDANYLDRMDLLVLLDLLGAKQPEFYNFFSDTQGWYKVLANAETKLKRSNLLRSHTSYYFKKKSTFAYIEDDHIPFLQRHVPVLHIIPVSFPKEWHTEHDNRSIIDLVVTQNLIKILSVFTAEYLHLVT